MTKKKKTELNYKVPYGYFENLEERIVANVKKEEELKPSIYDRLARLFEPKKLGIAFAVVLALIAVIIFLPVEKQFDLDQALAALHEEEIEEYLEMQIIDNDELLEEFTFVSLDNDSWNLDHLDKDEISSELENYDELEYLLEL